MRYNSLQATVEKRFSHGLSFKGSYTYSRAFQGTLVGDSTITSATDSAYPFVMVYTRNPYYRPHRFALQYSYNVPSNLTGVLGKLTNGWKVSGQATIQNGTPMTITDSKLGTIFGQGGYSTAQFCPGMGKADAATSGRTQDRLGGWVNKAAFCTASAAQISGGTGFGNAGPGIVLGPGQNNWDVSLSKSTKVGVLNENAAVEFRAEFFNAFNHPQFSSPGSRQLDVSGAGFGTIANTSVNPRLIQFALKFIF